MEKQDINEVFILIENYLGKEFLKTYISDLKYSLLKHSNGLEFDNCNEYTPQQVITIYTIDRLYELNKIPQQTYILLKELYAIKLSIGKMIKEVVYEIINRKNPKKEKEKLNKLYEVDELINQELNKYGLDLDEIKVEEIIDAVINSREYPKNKGYKIKQTIQKIKRMTINI